MRQATLCFLIKEDQDGKKILLAMKKRGFGAGKWNGCGGKVDLEKGDRDIEDTAIRETKEEIGVVALKEDLEKVAHLNFYFPRKQDWNQSVHVFFIRSWKGEPAESEEMRPEWFQFNKIPYEEMWDDDKFWLKEVLKNKKIKADFFFKNDERVDKKDVKIIRGFN